MRAIVICAVALLTSCAHYKTTTYYKEALTREQEYGRQLVFPGTKEDFENVKKAAQEHKNKGQPYSPFIYAENVMVFSRPVDLMGACMEITKGKLEACVELNKMEIETSFAKFKLLYPYGDWQRLPDLMTAYPDKFSNLYQVELHLVKTHDEKLIRAIETTHEYYSALHRQESAERWRAALQGFSEGMAESQRQSRSISCTTNRIGNTYYSNCR